MSKSDELLKATGEQVDHGAIKAKAESLGAGAASNEPANSLPPVTSATTGTFPMMTESLYQELQELRKFRDERLQADAAAVDFDSMSKKDLTTKFGKGFVHATNTGGIDTYFTRLSWDRMGGASNTDGWKEVVKKPAEVIELEAKKAK